MHLVLLKMMMTKAMTALFNRNHVLLAMILPFLFTMVLMEYNDRLLFTNSHNARFLGNFLI